MNFEEIRKIDSQIGTPFYIMSGDQYEKNILAFRRAFDSRCNLIIGYSFKTNYVPALCKIASLMGCYAEVVSEMEYRLAKKIGFEHVIFNGPIKKKNVLVNALQNNAIINLDSIYELEIVLNYRKDNPNAEIGIGLRLNIDLINESGVSKVQNGLRVGRFGFTSEKLSNIIPILRQNGIKIISLHGHTSSSDRAVGNYEMIVRQMLEVCENFSLDDLKYFDVGGGFFGAPADGIDISHKPRYKDYADCIISLCESNKWFQKTHPSIVIEPGVSVTANVFSYISKIFQKKEMSNHKFLTTDGTVFDVKPTLHNNNLPHTFYTQKNGDTFEIADLVGSTCMEKDIILKDIKIPSYIHTGDYIKIDGVGAYTIALTPIFINFLSPIIEIKDGGYHLVRRRQTVDDIISLYKI